ncbi:hypothetical protein EVAR_37326_1 [Eumeta japonica]|uniref:Uncharacterized protein n=1 Tax=Eumeta variegata TaxID=151549 RepID=A0A4C1WY07_EUMVA|nr:hypothetical protein EVAR_37326_1 [Eumeta japonica]
MQLRRRGGLRGGSARVYYDLSLFSFRSARRLDDTARVSCGEIANGSRCRFAGDTPINTGDPSLPGVEMVYPSPVGGYWRYRHDHVQPQPISR